MSFRKFGPVTTTAAVSLLLSVLVTLSSSAFALSPPPGAGGGGGGGGGGDNPSPKIIPPGGSVPKKQQHHKEAHGGDSIIADRSSSTSEQKSTVKKETDISKSKKKQKKPKKHHNNNNKKPSTSSTSSSTSSATQSDFIRRVKKEYKDAVELGIAYDWVRQKRTSQSSSKKQKKKKRLTTTTDESTSSSSSEQLDRLICLGPLATNLRHWHFSFRGAGIYEAGIYHGLILLPKNYPLSPPKVQLWTPSGRFVPYHDICLSASNYHSESWTPRWTVLSLVQSLRLHMLTNPQEIGGKTSNREETLEYAKASLQWKIRFTGDKTSVIVDHLLLQQQGFFGMEEEEKEAEGAVAVSGMEQPLVHDESNYAEKIIDTKNSSSSTTIETTSNENRSDNNDGCLPNNDDDGIDAYLDDDSQGLKGMSPLSSPLSSDNCVQDPHQEVADTKTDDEQQIVKKRPSNWSAHNNDNGNNEKIAKALGSSTKSRKKKKKSRSLDTANTVTSLATNKKQRHQSQEKRKLIPSPVKVVGIISKVFLSSPLRIAVLSLVLLLWIISIP